MKSALAFDKNSFELFEGFEDDEEEGIDNGAEFGWETEDFDTELTEFEGDEEVKGRRGRSGAPGSGGKSTLFSRQRPGFRGRTRFARPSRLRRGRPRRRISRRLAFPLRRRRLTVGFPPEETLQGAEFVRWVQASLNRVLALRLPVNGILGPETRSAVRRFQERERLPVTGIVGPDTERALIAALARVAPAGPAPAEPAEPEPSEGELDDLEFAEDSGEWGEEVADFLEEEDGAPRRARRRTAPVKRINPQYPRFLNLDRFNWNEALLTPRLKQMVGHLAKHVRLSWQSMRPIGYIRLIGHTDNTGREKYNRYLGDRRARAVKEQLETILKHDILNGRIRNAILLEPSPGASAPLADNRTGKGRALNRRVEVFVEPYVPLPKPPKPIPLKVEDTGPGPSGTILFGPGSAPPTPPQDKSLDTLLRNLLRDFRVPKPLGNQILDAATGKNFGLLNSLLSLTGISGPAREAILQTVRALIQTPVR